MYPFAENPNKLARAIKAAGSDDPVMVYEKYVELGGKIVAGYTLEKSKHAKSNNKVDTTVSAVKQVNEDKPKSGTEKFVGQFKRSAAAGGSSN